MKKNCSFAKLITPYNLHYDENFTFSSRQKGDKGAELDYFIGTEKSNYFGTTFWTIPVSFPGSSGDLIDVFHFSIISMLQIF